MGFYQGRREGLCPRCGEYVITTFISITPMSFSQKCSGCGTISFTEEEEKQLGHNQYLEMTWKNVEWLDTDSKEGGDSG